MDNPTFDPLQAELAKLWRRYGVRRLDLFGSATTAAFDPAHSDVDFLVEFDADPSGLFERHFGLKESLEALYGRPVDLVTASALENPFFRARVEAERRPVHAP
jgi:predicted nucleotidyltransferase